MADQSITARAIALERSKPPVIDTHIHLFDPTRPGGIAWPYPGDDIYKPSLPDRYEQIAQPNGVVGAIAVEASPLPKDNDWLLGIVANNKVMVGMIGDLVPGSSTYRRELERLHRNPLFLGIRYGNLWNRDLATDIKKDGFVDDLNLIAQAGLVLETANPDPSLISAVLDIALRIPELRIVIDHLPHAQEPSALQERKQYWAQIAELGQSRCVYAKLSEVPIRINGQLEKSVGIYQSKLDSLWQAFGPERVMFGSDWPNSDHIASYNETFVLVKSYVSQKGSLASRNFFATNSLAAYRWHPRLPDQSLPVLTC